jgi:predicted nucleic acid-binding protein
MSADFLDSNVFVYLFDETDARRREIARRIVHEGRAARVSGARTCRTGCASTA